KQKLAQDDMDAALSRVRTTTSIGQLGQCDLVIESIVEDLDAKLELVAELGGVLKPEAIVATNTSTLSVEALAQRSGRPGRTVGIHFFNPATTMPLVEVVRAASTSDETVAAAESFARRCGKEPVHVLDRPGFIVNALLFPYLNNAVRMLENGTASAEDIDTAMKGGCNFPMGPLALLDLVGLDTSVAILDALYEEFKDPNYSTVPVLRRMVAAGHLGRKSGRGFYDYAR
ncbi:MAG: 3-hydroxyacyl-CoA dehydrogenase family protein, partial [Actinomycetes bacterium]